MKSLTSKASTRKISRSIQNKKAITNIEDGNQVKPVHSPVQYKNTKTISNRDHEKKSVQQQVESKIFGKQKQIFEWKFFSDNQGDISFERIVGQNCAR